MFICKAHFGLVLGLGCRLVILASIIVLQILGDSSVACQVGVEAGQGEGKSKGRWTKPTGGDLGKFLPDPVEGDDIGVDSQEGRLIDGNLNFYDSDNRLIKLSNFFQGSKRPYLVSFNYSDCPKLCSVQLENMTMALREVDLAIGTDFDFISISIDPNETVATARKTKELYSGLYNRSGSEVGWHFLVGEEAAIQNLADQFGYRYKYVPSQKLFSHPPAFMLVSPDGKIVRYIPGLDYDPATVRLALIEAAEGKIGSPVNWALYSLGCFSYDGTTGKYTFQAMSLMRIAGMVMVIGILVGLIPYWFRKPSAVVSGAVADGGSQLSNN